ncbi:MAG TPA: hypothetical protein PKA31_01045 [Candidatus Moranbacteria bacterium]|nr:hypothetical protein [Candidatus Moranbacteria bacterium]
MGERKKGKKGKFTLPRLSFWGKKQEIVDKLRKGIRFLGYLLAGILALSLLLLAWVNIPLKEPQGTFALGTTFSQRYAQDIGLDWRKVYIALLDDLQMRDIRIPVYWDFVEPKEGEYDFADLDWQLAEAQKRGARITLVVGQKVPRWPECYIPSWAEGQGDWRIQRQLEMIRKVVERYREWEAVARWQVENEPFLAFGICPPLEGDLLDKEISLVRSLDPSRPIVVTDSGELSLWVGAAKRADVFGTTMYREVYSAKLGHWNYPIGPNFFRLKRVLVSAFTGQKNFMVAELQGEPWVKGWTVHAPLETQLESMNAAKLLENIAFAKKTGMTEIHIWGVEWWYWLMETQGDASVWNAARSAVAGE